jgi:hypothetical protein
MSCPDVQGRETSVAQVMSGSAVCQPLLFTFSPRFSPWVNIVLYSVTKEQAIRQSHQETNKDEAGRIYSGSPGS